jgi:dTDP-4-dehydrorhamnose reductase
MTTAMREKHMSHKWIVTGAGGILGDTFLSELGSRAQGLHHSDIELSDLKSLEVFGRNLNCDVFIHCAAMTNVDLCESERERAYRINSEAVGRLAAYTRRCGALFLYISSTGIYGNWKSTPYTEDDMPKPTTVYHKSKFEGEEQALEANPKTIVLRAGWIFGGGIQHRKNFVANRLKEASGLTVLYSDPTQIGSPTYAANLVRQALLLIELQSTGIYNCVDLGAVARLDYVNEIMAAAQNGVRVEAGPQEKFKRIAPVSFNESGTNMRLKRENIDHMQDWKVSLHQYVKNFLSQEFE